MTVTLPSPGADAPCSCRPGDYRIHPDGLEPPALDTIDALYERTQRDPEDRAALYPVTRRDLAHPDLMVVWQACRCGGRALAALAVAPVPDAAVPSLAVKALVVDQATRREHRALELVQLLIAVLEGRLREPCRLVCQLRRFGGGTLAPSAGIVRALGGTPEGKRLLRVAARSALAAHYGLPPEAADADGFHTLEFETFSLELTPRWRRS